MLSTSKRPALALATLSILTLLSSAPTTGQQAQQSRPLPVVKNWSDPSAWGGAGVPGRGADVVIPSNHRIILDVPTGLLHSLTIHGSLIAKRVPNLVITSERIVIMNGGVLRFGTKALPFADKATLRLTGDRPTPTPSVPPRQDSGLVNSGMVRAIMVHNGGTLALHGVAPDIVQTTINNHLHPLDTTVAVETPDTGWVVGDQLAIGTTDFYGIQETAIVRLADDALNLVTALGTDSVAPLTAPFGEHRWGALQYVSDVPNGTYLSLTPAPALVDATPLTPTMLDERAPVAHLTRSIIIEGKNDAAWNDDGFGVHVMIHGPSNSADPISSKCRLNGVMFQRCGQRQFVGRYPLHWHMLSYQSPSKRVVPAGNHYVNRCSVVDSTNRAIVIHGTCGVSVTENVAVNIEGHAFFLEDGSEENNVIERNIAMRVRAPGPNGDGSAAIKAHDLEASGFWITNPNNRVVDNRACDAQIGIWNSFATQVFGLSHDLGIATTPHTVPLPEGDHSGNIGHSNRLQGILTDRRVTDEAGTTTTGRYEPAPNGTFSLIANQVWKNGANGYENRAAVPTYSQWTVADNHGMDFFGATEGGEIRDTLFVAESLNSVSGFPTDVPRAGAASYHYAIAIKNITAVGYVESAPVMTDNYQFYRGGGFLDASDLYLFGVAKSGFKNSNWNLKGSHPGYLSASPEFDTQPIMGGAAGYQNYRHWSLAGAIHDPHGYWGAAGNYLVPAVPFYADETPGTALGQEGPVDFISTPQRFLGLESFRPDYDSHEFEGGNMAIKATRYPASGAPSSTHEIPRQLPNGLYPWFRYFAVKPGDEYVIEFPDPSIQNGGLPTTELIFKITNSDPAAADPQDVLLALPWDGGNLSGWLRSGSSGGNAADEVKLTVVHNKIDVINDMTGSKIWLDDTAPQVWYHFNTVLANGSAVAGLPGSDNYVLNPQYVVLRSL